MAGVDTLTVLDIDESGYEKRQKIINLGRQWHGSDCGVMLVASLSIETEN